MKLEWSISSRLEVDGQKVDGRSRLARSWNKANSGVRGFRLSMKAINGERVDHIGVVAAEAPRWLVAQEIRSARKQLQARASK